MAERRDMRMEDLGEVVEADVRRNVISGDGNRNVTVGVQRFVRVGGNDNGSVNSGPLNGVDGNNNGNVSVADQHFTDVPGSYNGSVRMN